MESPKLKTLYDLLAEDYTVAQLATAIETHGVYGWDRFGRFFGSEQPHSKKLAPEALDALAVFNEYQTEFFEKRDASNDDESIDLTAPINMLDHPESTPLHRLGWLDGKLPEFPNAAAFPPPQKPRRKPTQGSSTLHVLGALLLHLRDLRFSGKVMRIPAEDEFIGDIQDKFPSVKWLSRTTIQNNFGDAKKAVEQAQRNT